MRYKVQNHKQCSAPTSLWFPDRNVSGSRGQRLLHVQPDPRRGGMFSTQIARIMLAGNIMELRVDESVSASLNDIVQGPNGKRRTL